MTAAMHGERFSIVTVTRSIVNALHYLVDRAGAGKKLASVRAIETPVLDLATDKASTVEKLIAEWRKAIERDRADTLVLGCMSMGFLGVAEEMAETLAAYHRSSTRAGGSHLGRPKPSRARGSPIRRSLT